MDKLDPPKKLSLSSYQIYRTLGVGSFSRVRLARETDKSYVAIKSIKKAEAIKYEQVDHIMSECTLLGSITHPFIVL